jgi:hypothetical protein
MKPLAFVLLMIALHLGIASISASRHLLLGSSSVALVASAER